MRGFSEHVMDGPRGPIAYSDSGTRPQTGTPIILLHGFPQTRAMWHGIAPELAKTRRVICPDLRGYGASAKPLGTEHYSFREMASDILALADALDLGPIHLAGHDRGARTAHRLALDAPNAVRSLTLMDIVPTHTLFRDLNREVALGYYHWFFLAQPSPLPEQMIAADPDRYFMSCLTGWGTGDAPAFDRTAVAAYAKAWRDPETIRAMCDDYRAGASLDVALDASDLDKRVTCPALVLYAKGGLMDKSFDMHGVWTEKLSNFTSAGLPGGHFFPDHYPRETLAHLTGFLNALPGSPAPSAPA